MKVKENLSLISIIVGVLLILCKLPSDIHSYQVITAELAKARDISPTISSGGIFASLFRYTVIGVTPLVISILGFRRKNNYRGFALALNLFNLFYLLLPVGLMLGLLLS